MSQNITLMGADYTGVPAVKLPKTGGGTATFLDVTDPKVMTLLATKDLGSVSTSSSTGATINKPITVANAENYDLLVVISSNNSPTNGRHLGTVTYVELYNTSDVTNRNSASIATSRTNFKRTTDGVDASRVSGTAYGVYANSCTISSGTATIEMYCAYNNSNTGTVNGTYTGYVYGVKMYNLVINS